MTQKAECKSGDGVDAPRVEELDEELFSVLGVVSGNGSKELSSERLVEGTSSDCKGQCLNHILHKYQISHIEENVCKLHEDFFGLDTMTKTINNLI